MASQAQIEANRANAKKSTGPRSDKGKSITRFNALTHGLRAAQPLLPGERAEDLHQFSDGVRAALRPRDMVEEMLVQRTIRLKWTLGRIESSRDERLLTRADEAVTREDDDVERLCRKLYYDKRGHYTLHGIEVHVNGEEQTSSCGKDDDADRPATVLKDLESTAKGCRFLIEQWKSIAERVNNHQRVQSHDRFRATRLLGCDPLDVMTDVRVAVLYLATFALRPGARAPYADLRGELSKKTFHRFVEKLWIQWPNLFLTSDTPTARRMLTELISGSIARLTAKLEAHADHAAKDAARRAIRARYDPTPQGEQMLRAELRFGGALERSVAAFRKHRKEMDQFGGMMDEAGEPTDEAAIGSDWRQTEEVGPAVADDDGTGSDWRQTAEDVAPVAADDGTGSDWRQTEEGVGQSADDDGVAATADPVVDVMSDERESTAEIEPVEPEPVGELASAEPKMTIKANLAQPESAGELASEPKITIKANLAGSEPEGEPGKGGKNGSEEDIPPTNGVEVELRSSEGLVVGRPVDWHVLDDQPPQALVDPTEAPTVTDRSHAPRAGPLYAMDD